MDPVNIGLAINAILGLLDRVMQYKGLVDKAKAENRDITEGELDALRAQDEVARMRLKEAIDNSPGA